MSSAQRVVSCPISPVNAERPAPSYHPPPADVVCVRSRVHDGHAMPLCRALFCDDSASAPSDVLASDGAREFMLMPGDRLPRWPGAPGVVRSVKEKREKRAGRLQVVVRPRPRAVRHSTDRRHLPLSVLTRPPSRFAACLVRTLLLLPCGPRWSAGLQYSAYRGTVSATLQVCLSYDRFRALQDRTSRLAQRALPLNEGFQ